MNLIHGTFAKDDHEFNYWEDDTRTHLIQERIDGVYVYYHNHVVKDSGTPEELAQKHGFTLAGTINKGTVINQVNNFTF